MQKNEKVRDHDHLSGKFRGISHKNCNLQAKKDLSNFVPIFFHNFSGYDCHLIFESIITKAFEKGYKLDKDIKIIPKTIENFISLQIGKLRFLDSYRFLQSSLSEIIKSINNYPNMNKNGLTDDLFKQKLAYPYEYFNINNFESPLNLKKEHFWSTLNQNFANEKDINRTNEIIKKFNIKNGKELTLLYLKTDVIQLADIFENFIKTAIKEYKINPLYCYSLPGYTWNAGLLYTQIKLDYIKDKNLLLLLENNIRGGISSIMGDRFIKSDDKTKIIYIDANNLYGYAMSQYLPTGNFINIEINDNNEQNIIKQIINTPDDSEIGYFIECDLEYPQSIKLMSENFPFCPYQTKPNPNLFSDYMNSVKFKNYRPSEKLVCDQTDKKNYMMHYRIFIFYLKMGMKVTKIHTVYKFNQSNWLKGYIDLNTQKRKLANNNFEKNLFKLLNNAFYGKTMENVRQRINIDIISNYDFKKIIHRQSKLSFKGIIQYYNQFGVYKFEKNIVVFDKPIYLGFCVLELSKLLMYEYYYYKFQPYFKNKIKLHYMDTDSFVLTIETNDIEKDLEHFKNDFDFSDINKSNKLYSDINKKVIGKFKIETSPHITIDEFISLRSKSYSFKIKDINKSKQKGVQKAPDFDSYIYCLENNKITNQKNYSIRSNNHTLSVVSQNKISLNPFDDKRLYINSIQSLPHDNHYQKLNCGCNLCLYFTIQYQKYFDNIEKLKEYKACLNQKQLIDILFPTKL